MAANCSRTSGVAPLSVHFDADVAASTPTVRHFHDYEYNWDFGDSASGSWGTTGKSKNSAKGPVATHIYETAGTFTASYTVHNVDGDLITSGSFEIIVTDPDTVYAGTLTTCVSDVAHDDFTGAPAGSTHVTTDTLSTIAGYATAGHRILFHRGSSWTTSAEIAFNKNAGPVTIGAYGAGTGADELGIYSNNPQFTITGASLFDVSDEQDWRIMDLHFVDTTRSYGALGGLSNMSRITFLRLRLEGFSVALGWGHWNTSAMIAINEMVISCCKANDSDVNVVYFGAERLALLGSVIYDARTSHVVRCWQCYKGTIQHNIISGSSLDNTNGRHALKFHGPGDAEWGVPPTVYTGELEMQTSFAVISDNVFGSSGVWPVGIGPQDSGAEENLFDILFERNRIVSGYGNANPTPVQIALHIWACYVTVRNNILDGSSALSHYYTGISVARRGVEAAPTGVHVYNNTIYLADDDECSEWVGISIGADATATIVRNNLISFPGAVGEIDILDASADLVEDHNLMTDTPGFIDPDNATPLSRDFGLLVTSPAIDQGSSSVAVFEDFGQNARGAVLDVGAYEYLADDGSTIVYVGRLIGNGNLFSPTVETNAETEYPFEFRTSVTMRF